jgi:hypothetical protein
VSEAGAVPPAFGPTSVIPCDENSVPFAVVTLSVTVSREQLRTMLAIGHAEQSGEPPLPELSVLGIRREVEGQLAAGAVLELDRETSSINARLSPELAAELDAAVDRAYTQPEPAAPRRQDPRYGEGTVTLQTQDRGEVTVTEPAWCVGHDDEYVGYLADVTHNGRRAGAQVATEQHGIVDFLDVHISHAPHRELVPEPHPVVSVALDCHQDFTAEDGTKFARGLRVAAARLERIVAEAQRFRGGGRP